jgi:hypothetical protein
MLALTSQAPVVTLSGSVAGTSSGPAANLRASIALTGQSVGSTNTSTPVLPVTRGLSVDVSGASATAGSVRRTAGLSSAVVASSSVTPPLSVVRKLVGAFTGVSSHTASLGALKSLSGTSVSTSGMTVRLIGSVKGLSAAVAIVAGRLTVVPRLVGRVARAGVFSFLAGTVRRSG